MNEAVVDHGPTPPWYSDLTRQVCRVLGVRFELTVNDGELTNPESWTMAFAALKTWNRYWNAPPPPNNGVEEPAVSVGVDATA
jgi:hypothetical protein